MVFPTAEARTKLNHRNSSDTYGQEPRHKSNMNWKTYFLEQWFLMLYSRVSSHLLNLMKPLKPIETNCETEKPTRMKRQFFHQSQTKLFNLLRRTNSSDADAENVNNLNYISNRSDNIKLDSSAPLRFRVSLDQIQRLSRRGSSWMYCTLKFYKLKHYILDIVNERTNFITAKQFNKMAT